MLIGLSVWNFRFGNLNLFEIWDLIIGISPSGSGKHAAQAGIPDFPHPGAIHIGPRWGPAKEDCGYPEDLDFEFGF